MTVILFLNHDEQLSAVMSDNQIDVHFVEQNTPAYELIEDRKYGDEVAVIVSSDQVTKVMELLDATPRIVDYTEAFLRQEMDAYLDIQGVDLTESQYNAAKNGVEYWLKQTLDEAIADSVSTAMFNGDDEQVEESEELLASLRSAYQTLRNIYEDVKPDDLDPDEVEDMQELEDMKEPNFKEGLSYSISLLRHFISDWLPEDEETRTEYIQELEATEKYEPKNLV